MPSVIVIGSGLAGMGDAFISKEADIDVKVLVALPEAGGIVSSRQWGGAWIDY